MQDLLPPLIWSLELAAVLWTLASIGVVFKKFGYPAWAVLIPVYGFLPFMLIAQNEQRPKDVIMTLMMLGLFLVPGLNVLLVLSLCVGMARRTNHHDVYGVGLFVLPFVFWPHLALSLRPRAVQA